MSDHTLSSISLLERLVNIDSTTNDLKGVRNVQNVVAEELNNIGFSSQFVSAVSEASKKTAAISPSILVGEYIGQRNQYITLICHADTVLNLSTTGKFKSDAAKNFATGSGVIDDKGGIVIALRGLRDYLESLKAKNMVPTYSIRFVCSPNEETGSAGFAEQFQIFSRNSAMALGFEPALADGSIIDSRRGNRWYEVKVRGQEAHSGRCKGEEINAAHELGIKISKLHALNDAAAGINVNVGHISGGMDAFNIVCGNASAKIDFRFADFESRNRTHDKIDEILKSSSVRSIDGKSAHSSYQIVDDSPPFASSGVSQLIARYYLDAVLETERRQVEAHRGGGASDMNNMSRPGLVMLDGLGAVGANMHCDDEIIDLRSLATRAEALARFLGRI